MKKNLSFLICSLVLWGCTQSAQFSDPAQPIEVVAGNQFQIVLDSNPTTGYHWEFVEEVDGSVIQFVSKDYNADEPVMPGSGGTDVWTFKALVAGETHITLGYYSPSNDPEPPQQTITFTVTVK